MKLAIMQPYFFPYIGYWQLINAVDRFVIYDDVNYIKGGWINRNYILASQEKKQRITLSLKGASPNRLINQIQIGDHNEKLLKTIWYSYKKAPQFAVVFPILEQILTQQEKNLARYLSFSLRLVCDHLGLQTTLHLSSTLEKDNNLRGQDKVLVICEKLRATQYINLPGGQNLYDQQVFAKRGIKLSFIKPHPIVYNQCMVDYFPYLSIIDVMMFNDRVQCRKLLKEYDIT